MHPPSKGVLLVNLGTPRSPSPRDVYRYLIEFLNDKRVLNMSWLKRQLLIRGVIVPFRYRQSAKAYQTIWTAEGSPLLIYGKKIQESLQTVLGSEYLVELGMRYQEPSLDKILSRLLEHDLKHLIVLPLFPQYSSATTGSVFQRILEVIQHYPVLPKLTFINQFAAHPQMVEAFSTIAQKYALKSYDHILFSFHGLPEKMILDCDRTGQCLRRSDCCTHNSSCYRAQCYQTMNAIMEKLGLPQEKCSICFQSRLGKDPWLQPYTGETLQILAKKGCKRILLFSPAFVCDCLETLYEIGIEYAQEFKHAGGETLDLVHGLNDHPLWIKALEEIVLSHSIPS